MKYRLEVLLLLFTFCFTPLLAQQQKGKASYYSRRSTGARTSSGERLHHDSLTCAHRTYPFGTILKVTNPNNGNEVLVKVTDRGPFGRGRVIDLSYRAAHELGIINKGVSMVIVEPVEQLQIPYKANDIDLPKLALEAVASNYKDEPEWTTVKMKRVDARNLQKSASVRPYQMSPREREEQDRMLTEISRKPNVSHAYSKRQASR